MPTRTVKRPKVKSRSKGFARATTASEDFLTQLVDRAIADSGVFTLSEKERIAVRWLIEACAWLPAQNRLSHTIMDLAKRLREAGTPEPGKE